MIQGRSQFIYRSNNDKDLFISKGLLEKFDHNVTPLRIHIQCVENDILNIEALKTWRPEFANAKFELENELYICGSEMEKMSKSKHNVVNPDDVIDKYGADTFRMYEMFLGPVEQSKPWNTDSIEGVSKFLRKFWKLYLDEGGNSKLKNISPNVDELKILNKTLNKVEQDIENFSFNTSISAFMIAVNELTKQKTNSTVILTALLKAISPFAPHMAEVVWLQLGNDTSIVKADFPKVEEQYLKDAAIQYPVSINGKLRTKIEFKADIDKDTAKGMVLNNEIVKKWIGNKELKKFIFVKSKMINLVV